LKVKPGSHNGESGGIKILLDVETFDFTFSNTDSHGFRIVFGEQRDKQIITQDGYLLSTGKKNIHFMKLPNKYYLVKNEN
jgi:hypothetical protein